ncbi:MAG: hypothetical protein QGG40_18370, partial [Myxococcota bacterium]|nr:hypothetical protein [Myxococcota bacterium]
MTEAQESWLHRYFRLVLAHPTGVVLSCALITVLSLYAISHGVISSTIGDLFFGDDPGFQAYEARMVDFVNDDVIVIGYEDPEPLSPGSRDRIERAVLSIEAHPQVQQVHSILDAVWIQSDETGMLRVQPYTELADEIGVEQARTALADDPAFRDVLISADGRHAAVIVELTVDSSRSGEQTPALLEEITTAFE